MGDCEHIAAVRDSVLNLAASSGAEYADVRIIDRDSEHIMVRTGKVEDLRRQSDSGLGVRVLCDGAWGFAASPGLTVDGASAVTAEAVEIARASASISRKPVRLAPKEPHTGSYTGPCEQDPFDVPLNEKIALLKQADEIMRRRERVKVTECSMSAWRTRQTYADTDGSRIEQTRTECGAGITATAIEAGDVQSRSYPCSMGGDFRSAGYEFIRWLDLPAHAERIAREAAELIDAPTCPSGEHTVIITGGMLALQVHESCGHPIELDRVFGTESSFAGTSFLTTEKLNSFRYGSEHVNITADATIPHALGSFAFDDEGVPAQCVPVVEKGVFRGYLTSRETAAEMGWTSGGAMRADGWDRIPLIRMTNINLLPGAWTLDELVADTDYGLLIEDCKSWSIDDKRLNFQFGAEIAWEIKDGRIARMFKNPVYSGMTPEFWGNCDAVCDSNHWRVWGVPNCGKGEPMQIAHVGHGVAPARFRNVRTEGAR